MDLDTLIQKYTPILKWYVLRILCDSGAAEEVVQDTFMTAWRKQDIIGTKTNVRNYLICIARSRAVDYIRHHARRRAHEVSLEALPIKPHQSGPEATVLGQLACNEWRTLVARLSRPYRDCVELRATGTPYHEIAATLRIPLNTVKSRLGYVHVRARTLRAQMGFEETA